MLVLTTSIEYDDAEVANATRVIVLFKKIKAFACP
jgi:hypothetical protein